jgi:hypothetical protein
MHEFFAALISFFLIDPLQSAMADRFGNVSREQIASVTTCLGEATPVLIQQAFEAPWQTATQVIGIWSGMTLPEEILAKTTPGCAETVGALRASSEQGQG